VRRVLPKRKPPRSSHRGFERRWHFGTKGGTGVGVRRPRSTTRRCCFGSAVEATLERRRSVTAANCAFSLLARCGGEQEVRSVACGCQEVKREASHPIGGSQRSRLGGNSAMFIRRAKSCRRNYARLPGTWNVRLQRRVGTVRAQKRVRATKLPPRSRRPIPRRDVFRRPAWIAITGVASRLA
jgi:hypothetical protein